MPAHRPPAGCMRLATGLHAQGWGPARPASGPHPALLSPPQINIKHLIRAELKDTVRKMIAKQKSPARTLMRDKLIFVVCTVDLYLSAYWLGC